LLRAPTLFYDNHPDSSTHNRKPFTDTRLEDVSQKENDRDAPAWIFTPAGHE